VAVDGQVGDVDLDTVDDRLAVGDLERLRRLRADVGDVVPADLVERLGQFLSQPLLAKRPS
jgi:hypothetical protein